MRMVFGILGIIVGRVLGEVFFDSRMAAWGSSLVLGLVAFMLPSFLAYRKMSPGQALSFHGPGSPITHTQSSGELRSFLGQLADGGLLLSFSPERPIVAVDDAQWGGLSDEEQLTACQIFAQATRIDGPSPQEIEVVGRDGEILMRHTC